MKVKNIENSEWAKMCGEYASEKAHTDFSPLLINILIYFVLIALIKLTKQKHNLKEKEKSKAKFSMYTESKFISFL